MAKKKTKKKSKEVDIPKVISNFLKEKDIDVDKEVIRHLSNMAKKFDRKPDDVAKLYAKKLKGAQKRSKDPAKTALVRTKKTLNSERFKSSSEFSGIIVGISSKTNDLTGDRLKDVQKEYNKLIDSDEDVDGLEISDEDYQEYYKEYKKSSNIARAIEDVKKRTKMENEARDLLEVELDDRYVIQILLEDKNGDPQLDEDGDKMYRTEFVDVMKLWSKSKSVNFDYGKILMSNPQKQFSAIVIVAGDPKFVTVNVKGTKNIAILNKAPIHKPVIMKIVDNKKQKWYTDKKFSIKLDSTEDYGVGDELYKTIISYIETSFPKTHQVSVDEIDEWEKKHTKKTKKTNHMALVTGYVENVIWKDDGSDTCTIILSPEDEEFNMEEDDDDGEYLNTNSEARLRLFVNKSHIEQIDFEDDSFVYAIAEVYRGKFYNTETKQVNYKKPAVMPGGTIWGVFADPDEKTLSDRGEDVSEDDYETSEEDEDYDDEDDTDYVDDEDEEEEDDLEDDEVDDSED